MDRPRVVIITDKRDTHVPFVVPHLRKKPLLIDAQDLTLPGHQLSYELKNKGFQTHYGGADLNKVTGVWLRRPAHRVKPAQIPVDQTHQAYSASALNWHASFLYTTLAQARWVSDYFAMQKADHKSLQLATAQRIGFAVPETLITADAMAASEFIQKRGQVIVKPQATVFPKVLGKQQAFYATKISADKLPDLGQLHLAPAFFQALVVGQDIRVVVVGEQCFAAVIEPDNELGVVRDWRPAYAASQAAVTSHNLPLAVKKRCVALVHELGLLYGAIDLMLDETGEYWFLENNAYGQWAFVEEHTGQPIGKALARLLE